MLHILTPQKPGAGELYSLVRFLRIFPYAYYFCRKAGGCDCQSLDHKFKNRRACHHCGCASDIICHRYPGVYACSFAAAGHYCVHRSFAY